MLGQHFDACGNTFGTEDGAFPIGVYACVGEELADGRLTEHFVTQGDVLVQVEEGDLLRLGNVAGPIGMAAAPDRPAMMMNSPG